ncbi:hypothetical protein [Halorubrum sp. SD626R]|jgi:hypothetical protein|uniref:hypothetical protein n=1 Tax=Halorubrum sp. SD626R TaxID=1419722 RepID=UPI000AB17FDA|nr:hypothetical protein [Halorubrum sp. SD626R]TKX79443.1 hypothetical protein EXE53_15760 [Halorubrum sp. SD626R]
MNFTLQRALLLVLGGLVPAAVFLVDRAAIVVGVTLINVLIIYGSLRVATGGSRRFSPDANGSDASGPDEA